MSQVVRPFPVEKEFEKNPQMTAEDIKKLSDWLKTQPHLPAKYVTDLDLAIAYHSCEFSSEVTKQVLDLHYTLRTLFVNFFKDRAVDKSIEKTLNIVLIAPLPTATVHGYRAIYLRLLDPDPQNFNFNVIVRAMMMEFDLWQLEEGTWPGFVLIIDMVYSTLSHVAKLDLMCIRQVLYFLQECMLVRLKEVHFLNAPFFMDKIMMMLRPFMKKSLMDMIHIHLQNSEELYKYVPKEAFPKEEGGQYKDHDTIKDELLARFKSNSQFFKDEAHKRVEESLRPGGKGTVQDLFSIQGSFKKLDID